jgi:hypothetical protein
MGARLSRFAVDMSKIGGFPTRIDLPTDAKWARTVAGSRVFAAGVRVGRCQLVGRRVVRGAAQKRLIEGEFIAPQKANMSG